MIRPNAAYLYLENISILSLLVEGLRDAGIDDAVSF